MNSYVTAFSDESTAPEMSMRESLLPPSNEAENNHQPDHQINNDNESGDPSSIPNILCRRNWTKAEFLHLLSNIVTALFLLLPIYFTIQFFGSTNHAQYRLVSLSAIFVTLTLHFSLHELSHHLTYMHKPLVQKYVLRIIALVPLYSLQSWFTLWPEGTIREIGINLEPLRDLYEAYAISSFLYYLIGLGGGDDEMSDLLHRKDSTYGKHTIFPFRSLCREWEMGEEFLLRCKQGVLVFAILKLLSVAAVIIFKPLGLYGNDAAHALDPRYVYIYVAVILSASMTWALYCLAMLYYAIKDDLKEWNLVGKLLCIKGVVFFTFWQGIVITVIQHYGGLSWGNTESQDLKYVREKMQALLICVEMLGFAVAHQFAFTYKDYLPENRRGDGDDEATRDLMVSMHEGGELHADDGTAPARPMSAGSAFWSFMPEEGIADLKRLRRGIGHATNEKKEQLSSASVEMGLAQKL